MAPIEWFLVDEKYKKAMAIVARMDREVAETALTYLSLFRPASGRSVTPGKALRLITELARMLAAPRIETAGRVARPCPPRIWCEAMEQMISRRDGLRLPLKNHNYLRQVAYGLADNADATAEKARNQSEQDGSFRRTHQPPVLPYLRGNDLLDMELALVRRGKLPPGRTVEELQKMGLSLPVQDSVKEE